MIPVLGTHPEFTLVASREHRTVFLRLMFEKGSSDLHITAGAPPMLRIDGRAQFVLCCSLPRRPFYAAPRALAINVIERSGCTGRSTVEIGRRRMYDKVGCVPPRRDIKPPTRSAGKHAPIPNPPSHLHGIGTNDHSLYGKGSVEQPDRAGDCGC